MKVLIIRFSSIGDIVLTTPVIRCLKTQLNSCEVHYCTKKQYAGILEGNPYLDKIHLLDNSLESLIAELKKEQFDYIIDLHNNLRSRIIKLRLSSKSSSFDKLNYQKWLMVNFKLNKLPNRHIVDRYMDTLAPLGVSMDSLGLDYFIPEKDEIEMSWLPESHQKGYVAYAIGAQHNTKKLPLNRMIELCDKINKPIVLLGGKEDAETANKIELFFQRNEAHEQYEKGLLELNKKTIIYNACGKFNLNQSASLVKGASHVFSHDTGLMHIAAAFKKNIYSIWGNTIPDFGMYPYRTRFIILEKKGLKCRPCSKIGYKECPEKHFLCMNGIIFDFYLP